MNRLNIIHVTGTKGKGSTCAFVQSILLQYQKRHGFPKKIGLYTSPHLKAVRERIQINGSPVSEELFAKYFYEVWDRMNTPSDDDSELLANKPVYFRFLTLLCWHIFMAEDVDTAIIEVGVGGEYDSTNIIQAPTCTGISALGIDHVGVLGDTVDKIAWHKAGIFKPHAPAFSVAQPASAVPVIKERAMARNTTVTFVSVFPQLDGIRLGLAAKFQKDNASLAISLAAAHLEKMGFKLPELSIGLPDEFVDGLQTAKWPGRCDLRKVGQIEWCLDGAHTKESILSAAEWFTSLPMEGKKTALIFNQQTRDAPALLEILYNELQRSNIHCDRAVFCTNKPYQQSGYKADLVSANADSNAVEQLTVQKALAKKWSELDSTTSVEVASTIEGALKIFEKDDFPQTVLISGSLHLVGGALVVLEDREQGMQFSRV